MTLKRVAYVITLLASLTVFGVRYNEVSGNIPIENPLEIPTVYSVDRTWGVDINEEDVNCLAMNIYFEARNDSYEGKEAVALTVLNRAEHFNYPDSICKVIKQAEVINNKIVLHRCQFSWYCDGRSDKPILHNRLEKEAWEESKLVAHNVVKGEFDEYLASTHYHNTKVNPKWAPTLDYIGQIGKHKFYSL